MRLYISKITKHTDERKPDTYDFAKFIEGALWWPTKEAAQRNYDLHCLIEIRVELPTGQRVPCTDFGIEPRPAGGFVLSCEHPRS